MLLLSVSNEVDLHCGFVIGTQGAAIYSPAPQSSSRPPTTRYTIAMSLCIRPSDDTSTHVSAIRTGGQEYSLMVATNPHKHCSTDQILPSDAIQQQVPFHTWSNRHVPHVPHVHVVSKAQQIREQHVHRSSLPARAPCCNL